MKQEKEVISPIQVMEQFPYLNEVWIGANSANVFDGKRLLSPVERIASLGGIEMIQESSKVVAEKSRKPYIAILACQKDVISVADMAYVIASTEIKLTSLRGLAGVLEELQFLIGRSDLISVSRVEDSMGGIRYEIDRAKIGYQARENALERFTELYRAK